MDRSTMRLSATPGTVAHLASTAGTLHYQLLVSRSAHSSMAQQAHGRLCVLVTQRIRSRAMALVQLLGLDDVAAEAEVSRLLEVATPVVMLALTAYRSRSTQNFSTWLDRRIDDALRGEPLDGPPTAAVPLRAALALEQLSIPQAERHAVLAIILRQLPAPERRVLEYRAESRATWTRVAEAMGMSVAGVRALHRLALERAQHLALELVQPTQSEEGMEWRCAA